MSSGYEIVDKSHVGGHEKFLSEWKTIQVVFHDFAELPSNRGNCTTSSVLECHGFEWNIQLYPGGNVASEGDVFVSLFLLSKSSSDTNKIKSKWRIRIPSAGRAVGGEVFRIFSSHQENSWGYRDYAEREDVLDSSNNYLVDGMLTVEVDIQVMLDKPPSWTPTNQIETVCSDMLALFDAADADNTDVTFEVGSGDSKEIVYAHGLILAARCPTLASLAVGCDPDTPIPIVDVQVDVFRMLLRYVYGGDIPTKNIIKDQAKAIINAANRFECTGLKLTAEAELATTGITTENAAELILFADATNCAMLKENSMDFFVNNTQEVMASEGFAQVKESPSVMAELMDVALGGSKKRPASSIVDDERDYKRMRVATLWQKLDGKGLAVDGAKDILISRLEEADTKARAQAEALAQNGAENEDESEDEDE